MSGKTRNIQSKKQPKIKKATPKKPAADYETILLAVTGMSPAVLTETVYALANENPKVIPDRVIVITTSQGKKRLEEELMTINPDYGNKTVWDSLRIEILGEQKSKTDKLILDEIRVITRKDTTIGCAKELEDIKTPGDNEATADFILEEVRRITENPDTRLIASLAGGRKTMSALIYAAMSLLGRKHDRLTHVLVNEPFEDTSLKPRFYFPSTTVAHHQDRTGKVYAGKDAKLWLADVPFVRLRELFPKQLGRMPGSFNRLVEMYSRQIEEMSGPPTVSINKSEPIIKINDVPVKLSPREYLLYRFLLERCRNKQLPYDKQENAIDDLKQWIDILKDQIPMESPVYKGINSFSNIVAEDIRKILHDIKQKFIHENLIPKYERFILPQRGRFGIEVVSE